MKLSPPLTRLTIALTLALPAPSERVQINAGVLSGQTGEVLRVKTNNQVLVRVESLGLQLVAGLHGSQVSKA
jgi:transcription antitermination factor NusG